MGLWLDRGRECDNLRQAIEIQINHYLCGTDNPVSVALNTPLDRPIDRALRGFFIQFCYPSVTRTSKCRSLVANKPICNSELQPILERSHRFCIGKQGAWQDYVLFWQHQQLHGVLAAGLGRVPALFCGCLGSRDTASFRPSPFLPVRPAPPGRPCRDPDKFIQQGDNLGYISRGMVLPGGDALTIFVPTFLKLRFLRDVYFSL